MSHSQDGKESGERKKAKKEKEKVSKSDKKEKPSSSGNPTIINRTDFPSPEEVTADWKLSVPISVATDDGEDLPHGLRRPEIQACFVKEGYSGYQEIPPELGLQLLLLPSKTDDWDRTKKIWEYCTNLPPPRPDRWDTLEESYEGMIEAAKAKQKRSTESPEGVGGLRHIMDPTTTRGRTGLNLDDLSHDEFGARHDTDEHEEQGKSSRSSASRDHQDRPETPTKDRAVNFRHAIRAAWPNVGGIQHRLDRYISMDYEDMDWAAPSTKHKTYAKTHARWKKSKRRRQSFVKPTI